MAENWYYVQKGNRHGPVAIEVIEALLAKDELKSEDYVWKKGFENWKKIKEVSELSNRQSEPELPPQMSDEPELSLSDLNEDERRIYIRVGIDRGAVTQNDYGPFSLKQLRQLFKENRINGKTLVFIQGTREWKILGEYSDYEQVFHEVPPVIKEADRRATVRKPFVARMFFENNKNVYEGICRDVSVGGMQVLMDSFKGKEGDKISINVHPENTDYHFTAAGVVVRILEGNSGFSFRFHGLSDEARRAIEKYIQDN